MSVEHEVVEVDGLVVECWRDLAARMVVSASAVGAWFEYPLGNNIQHVVPMDWCEGDKIGACLSCLALRAHRRLKEQR